MAKCLDITPKRKKVCVGALRYRINIYNRGIVTALAGSAVHSEAYTLFKVLKASIETKGISPSQTLDGVTIDPDLIVTHVFIVRFLSTINTEQFIEFRGKNYGILKAENIDEAGMYLRLSANLRGAFNKAGAK